MEMLQCAEPANTAANSCCLTHTHTQTCRKPSMFRQPVLADSIKAKEISATIGKFIFGSKERRAIESYMILTAEESSILQTCPP